MTRRLALALALAALWFVLAGARLAVLQVRDHDRYVERASAQQQRAVELDPPRGTIYDARGRVMAVSVPVDSLYGVPREIDDPRAVAAALAPVLGVAEEPLAERLTGDGWWVWVARKLDPPLAARVRALDLPGIGFVEESKRYYPMRELAAPLLGYVGTDNQGLSGLELVYDERIAGRGTVRPVLRDNRNGRLISPDLSLAEPVPGEDLHLTLDATIQHIVQQELRRAVEANRARAGVAVLLDPTTGAVLAMASYPTYDANRALAHRELWRIRAISDVYEPGSTFKVVTAAAALEANVVDAADVFDCGLGGIHLYGVRIKDHKPFGRLTLRDVIAKSSNVGAIKVGAAAGRERLYQTLRAFGFGDKTGIDLNGESRGPVRPLERWQPITPAYVSFGQGIAVTPVQLAAAIAAVADEGRLRRPYLVSAVGSERRAPELVRQAVSPTTAVRLERLLEAVVAPGGTAGSTAIPGYRIAGKTGTAQKIVDGRYSHTRLVPNFVGFAPARQPVVAGVVVIDEPRAGATGGGAVAAPVFARIAERVLPYLGVAPDPALSGDWTGRGSGRLIAALDAPPAAPPALVTGPADGWAPAAGGAAAGPAGAVEPTIAPAAHAPAPLDPPPGPPPEPTVPAGGGR